MPARFEQGWLKRTILRMKVLAASSMGRQKPRPERRDGKTIKAILVAASKFVVVAGAGPGELVVCWWNMR